MSEAENSQAEQDCSPSFVPLLPLHTPPSLSSHAPIPEITNKSLCREGRKEAAAATAIFGDGGVAFIGLTRESRFIGLSPRSFVPSRRNSKEGMGSRSACQFGRCSRRFNATSRPNRRLAPCHVCSPPPLIYTTDDSQVCNCGPVRVRPVPPSRDFPSV